jgi:uncharacterized protein (TIGR00730 family)
MRICVFCGSKTGSNPIYAEAAQDFARRLATSGHDLIYGGGNIGLMGIIADAALAENGQVIGVIPGSLANFEIAHSGLTRLHIVKSMHERKALMAELSDAFVALPGGYGTLDEMFEILTWAQLRFHNKPVGMLDVDGFFTPLLAFLDQQLRQGFLREDHRQLLLVDVEPQSLLNRIAMAAKDARPVLRSPVEP